MISNLEKYKGDLAKLEEKGDFLLGALRFSCLPQEYIASVKNALKDEKEVKAHLKSLPNFEAGYQTWYSEAQALIKLLLPDRLADFVAHYEKPKTRKDITYENYRIQDCLQGLNVTRGYQKEKVVGPDAAIPLFRQQMAILRATKARFESSLFDIKQLLQADLFDSELEAARYLLKNKFGRASGAVAGVVLERHLGQVCSNHNLVLKKKDSSIADFNDAFKAAEVIDVAQWRSIQYLGDLRNLCDHSKDVEPTKEQVSDLLTGVEKISKTLY